MVEIITYSLLNGHKNSDDYYRLISDFTDEFLREGNVRVGDVVRAFKVFLDQSQREAIRPDSEYLLDLLTLGVLWRVYAPVSGTLKQSSYRILAWLVYLRRNYRLIKPLADALRGVLASLWLVSENHVDGEIHPNIKNLETLLHWLKAAGDFKEEAKRLEIWRDFLITLSPEDSSKILERGISLAGWFETRSEEILGRYTPNVKAFISQTLPRYRWREDRIFCGRERVEYHFSMVGAEILNRMMRERFLGTNKKMVLLPPCMSAPKDGTCKATPTPYGDKCAHCTPSCRVHQTTRLGEKYGFPVLMLPSDLADLKNGDTSEASSNGSKMGVVGVSCPLTNVSGGWQTRDLGVPAQGLLLDYCGCPYHWHLDEGIPTDINFDELLRMMGVKE